MGLSVAVVQGGPSTEAEVSRASAAGVAKALTDAGHAAVRFELDALLAEKLREGPPLAGMRSGPPLAGMRSGFDVVFPVVHGAVGEDGSLQGLLEVLGVPYVGSGVLASALAMDKRVARQVLGAAGLPIAKGLALRRAEDSRAAAERARRAVGARLVVKPSSHGSAIAVARLDETASIEAVARALEDVWRIDEWAVVEHFARGREITVSVLDVAPGPVALGTTEIVVDRDPFYTYEARYAPGRSRHVVPAPFPEPPYPEAFARRLASIAVLAHEALDCRDLSRVDFVVGDDGVLDTVTLLEVNTIPGFTPTSLYPEAAAAAGMTFASLCDTLVRSALARGPTRRHLGRPLPG